MAGTPGAATYVKTTSGSIITVVPKSLATLGGKIISSNIVSGRHMSIFATVKTCISKVTWACFNSSGLFCGLLAQIVVRTFIGEFRRK